MKTGEMFVSGVIAIGLVTAFGLHAANLSTLAKSTGSAAGNVLNVAEKG